MTADRHASRRAQPGQVVEMSATPVLRHLAAFRDEVGHEAVERATLSMSTDVQQQLDALVPGAWISTDILDEVYGWIAHEAGRDPDELLPRVFEQGNRDTLSTVWRALLRMAPNQLVLGRAGVVFQKTYSHGVMTARALDGGAEFEVSHWPGIGHNRLVGIAKAAEAALSLTGNDGARVHWTRTPDGARLTAAF